MANYADGLVAQKLQIVTSGNETFLAAGAGSVN